MNRYKTFLEENLRQYLENDLIGEIIITDENGEDVANIEKNFSNPKLRLYKNESQLGPFLNKLKAMRLAKNEWIAIIDSDNFADYKYFETVKQFILSDSRVDKESILAPSFAKPNFNYSIFSGNTPAIKSNMKQLVNTNVRGYTGFTTLMNTGNYVIHKYLVENINLENEKDIIPKTSACDVIYFNTLLLEQFQNLKIFIVSNLEYLHVVHNDSTYLRTNHHFSNVNHQVHQRFYHLIN